MDFRRRGPSSQTLDWVERVAGARVVARRRMAGGIASVIHRLTIDHGSYRDVLVLRPYEPESFGRGSKFGCRAALLATFFKL